MKIEIGLVKVLRVLSTETGCKVELSLPERHHYGYRRDTEAPQRPALDLNVTVPEAVAWLPFVGKTVECSLSAEPAQDDSAPAPPKRSQR